VGQDGVHHHLGDRVGDHLRDRIRDHLGLEVLDPVDTEIGRRWIWLVTVLIVVLGVLIFLVGWAPR